jgi:hypothetical protein
VQLVATLTHETWETMIRDAWSVVRNRVEVGQDLEFAHEHTLQFHLAWEVARLTGFSPNLHVRFEVRTVAPAPRGTILTDIIFWTDPEFRVAVELKAPVRSGDGSNSAMTHGRMAFYKDIDRLRYVVETPSTRVKRGMFLAVVNELGYVTHRQQHKNLGYNTFHQTTVDGGALIPATDGRNGCPYPLEMPFHPIRWTWDCQVEGGRILPAAGVRHYWLTPIAVLPTSSPRQVPQRL